VGFGTDQPKQVYDCGPTVPIHRGNPEPADYEYSAVSSTNEKRWRENGGNSYFSNTIFRIAVCLPASMA